MPQKPRTPSPRPVRLATVGQVRHELARVYRAAQRGTMLWADAARAANVLALIAKLITEHDLERRLREVEAQLDELREDRHDDDARERAADGRYHIQ